MKYFNTDSSFCGFTHSWVHFYFQFTLFSSLSLFDHFTCNLFFLIPALIYQKIYYIKRKYCCYFSLPQCKDMHFLSRLLKILVFFYCLLFVYYIYICNISEDVSWRWSFTPLIASETLKVIAWASPLSGSPAEHLNITSLQCRQSAERIRTSVWSPPRYKWTICFPFLSKPSSKPFCFEVGDGKGGKGRKKGGYRLYDTVFVFKEFRLAYKCIGEYNTFKVKLINLLVGSFMAIISRFF